MAIVFRVFSLFMSLSRLGVFEEVVDMAADESKDYRSMCDGKEEDGVLGV